MRTIASFAVFLLASPIGAAAAQDRQPREQVDEVVRCLDIANTDERLRCFDGAATVLREGLRTGAVAIDDGRARRELEARLERERERSVREATEFTAKVAASSELGSLAWRIEFDNGQVWMTSEPQRAGRPPAAGTSIKIEDGALGGHWMRLPSGRRYKVRRVG